MSNESFNFEDVRKMSNGLTQILSHHQDYDVRKIKKKPEYVVFYGDEEIGRWDRWGQKVLTMLWGVNAEKVYKNSPEAALSWILSEHRKRQQQSELAPLNFNMQG